MTHVVKSGAKRSTGATANVQKRLGPGAMMAAPEGIAGEIHATEGGDTEGGSTVGGAGTSCGTLDASWSLSEHAGPLQKGAAL